MRLVPPTPTVLDRIVGYVSPAAALNRMRARTMLAAAEGGWKGGMRDRRPTKMWRPGEGSADTDTLGDLPDLRARSRDLVRNTPIATGALATAATNVVGDGLQLQASIDHEALGITAEQADEYEREQEREFALFCRACDFTRVQRFDEMQRLVYRAAKESGDALAIRRYRLDPGEVYGTKVQILEADRLSNPNRAADTDRLAGGVETNPDGVPVAYHISNRHPGDLRAATLSWQTVPARDEDGRPLVIHLFERDRPELTRGIPYLAPVIEHLKQLSDYSDAEVTAAVLSAMYTGFIKSPQNEDANPIGGEYDATLNANEIKLGSGAMVQLAPGEDITFANPARPNANFDPFVQAFLRQVGVALELPFELLIKHFTASYSASRAALAMAWQFFERQRYWFAERFCQEVYGWFMEEAVATGRLARPGFFEDPAMRMAWLGAEWIGPTPPSLMPYQEAQADALDIETGVKTREQVCIERTGGEFELKHRQLAKEQAMRDEDGLAPKPAAPAAAAAPVDAEAPADGDPANDPPPRQAGPRRFVIRRPDGSEISGEVA